MCNVSKRCPHTDTYIIKKDETYDVKGEPVAVEANERVCKKCNEEIFDIWETRLKQTLENGGMNLNSNSELIDKMIACAKKYTLNLK